MAVAITRGVEATVTLATTVTRLTRAAFQPWSHLTIVRRTSGTTAVVFVVTDGTADGAALPTTGRVALPVSATPNPVSFEIAPYSEIGVAGDASGDVELVIT